MFGFSAAARAVTAAGSSSSSSSPSVIWCSVDGAIVGSHRLGQDSIHRRGPQNHSNINTGVRRKPAARGGPRSLLHVSVSSVYSTRIQPSL